MRALKVQAHAKGMTALMADIKAVQGEKHSKEVELPSYRSATHQELLALCSKFLGDALRYQQRKPK